MIRVRDAAALAVGVVAGYALATWVEDLARQAVITRRGVARSEAHWRLQERARLAAEAAEHRPPHIPTQRPAVD